MASLLDRADEHRGSAEWVRSLWYAEEARLVKITAEGQLAVCPDKGNEGRVKLRTTRPFVEYDSHRHILLGLVDDVPWFAVEALIDPPFATLREVGEDLTPLERDIAITTTAITNWHRSAPHCAACGHRTEAINGGFARTCPNCGREHFPRTDPAVIVAVVDDADRLLLARASAWGDTNRVSVLAGFVEAGESFEHAVHREIGEEADVQLTDLRYFGSQPWPFPRSVMVGFFARAVGTDISIDGEEIVFADWYTRERVEAELAAGTLGLPTSASIAHRLVTAWRDGAHPYGPRP